METKKKKSEAQAAHFIYSKGLSLIQSLTFIMKAYIPMNIETNW